jgi:hypothetical protein
MKKGSYLLPCQFVEFYQQSQIDAFFNLRRVAKTPATPIRPSITDGSGAETYLGVVQV